MFSLIVGIIMSTIIAALNSFHIYRTFIGKNRDKVYSKDLAMFYYRFFIDVYFSIFTIPYLLYIYFDFLTLGDTGARIPDPLAYVFAFSCYNSVIAHGYMAMCIVIARFYAVAFPIQYRKTNIPRLAKLAFAFAVFMSLSEIVVAYTMMYTINVVFSLWFLIIVYGIRKQFVNSQFIFVNVLTTRDIFIILFLRCIPSILSSTYMKETFPVFKLIGLHMPTIATIATTLEIASFTYYSMNNLKAQSRINSTMQIG
ncbi:unnamed protein product [Caenorhabditis bovis]|uniref:Uncharacterized protein n=1 Tax=Caenorhabditis bovis TaxID=2654633 RepID=A0A8S1F9X3_9PELO|nr:unnamed protein product [Caenorhabditis bovis]